SDADARARAAVEQSGDPARVELEPEQARDRGTGRQRQLRAGAETDVMRNRFIDAEIQARVEAIAPGQRFEMALRARRIGALRVHSLAAPERQARARRIDG